LRNIHISDSYDIWRPIEMKSVINCYLFYNDIHNNPACYLNRKMWTLIVEWWLHNICYYLTKPFCKIAYIRKLNYRFRDVDLEEWH
jgi:hypothetical protein